MPTPVPNAKQLLTSESARVLDAAVAVARRRFHPQTTSLHALSALLSLPSSPLRDACFRSRARPPAPAALSSRFHFRALDLCVAVSLDRLQSSKSAPDDDDPPVSNSLMAAIKRSQACQRRMPEMYQIAAHAATSIYSVASIKVELTNFVVSILDDPIVSRVLGDAGFRSTEIKLAILRPPSRRCPPVFPFSHGDEECRRIGEVLARRRNPVLIGVRAGEALERFKKRVESGRGLPVEMDGAELICVGKEAFELKAEEMRLAVESGRGVVVSFGVLEVLVEGGEGVVKRLSGLIEVFGKKMGLIGVAANYETYRRFVSRFPTLEVDWDLHPLPVTSSRSLGSELYSKSSLMSSFVPFGGFFTTLPDFRSPVGITNKPFTRCSMCNEKCEQELSAVTSRGSSVSVADRHSSSLPSWLQMANSDVSKAHNVSIETIDEKAESNAKILGIQKKWDGICQRFHQGPEIPRPAASVSNLAVPCGLGPQFVAAQRSRSGYLYTNDGLRSNLDSSVLAMVQKTFAHEQNLKAPVGSFCDNLSSQPNSDSQVSKNFPCKVDGVFPDQSSCNLNLAPDHVSCSSISCVTTDLGLGTSPSTTQELKKPDSHLNRGEVHHFSCSISTERPVREKASSQVFPYSFPAGELRCQLRDSSGQGGDYKLTVHKLTEKVAWQMEACCDVGQVISCRRGGNGEHCASDLRYGTWIGFIGPDKIGKKKMAQALAELMFGSKESLIAVDLSVREERASESLSVFDSRLQDDIGRKTVVDYIAGELIKKPRAIVFLNNVDKTDDILAQSLSRAIRTGKFPDSHAREVSVANAIFLIACNSAGEDQVHSSLNTSGIFSEQRILDALSWQMKIVTEHVEGETASKCSNTSTVTLATEESASHRVPTNKRKQSDTDEPFGYKKPRGFLDLNVPLEEDIEEVGELEINIADKSRDWLQDFLEQVHRKVAFKPSNFDALTNKLLNKMSLSLERSFGPGFRLEIDQEVMCQILAAALCSDGEGPVDDWIKEALGGACAEAQRRYRLHEQARLKLVSCPGVPFDKQAPGIRLPRMINLG